MKHTVQMRPEAPTDTGVISIIYVEQYFYIDVTNAFAGLPVTKKDDCHPYVFERYPHNGNATAVPTGDPVSVTFCWL